MTEQLSRQIDVEMGEWHCAEQPDWLTTHGLGPCIGIVIMNHSRGKAWLLHKLALADSKSDKLPQIIAEALKNQQQNDETEIWVGGGEYASQDPKEILADREYVIKRLREKFIVSPTISWGTLGMVEVTYQEGHWRVRSEKGIA